MSLFPVQSGACSFVALPPNPEDPFRNGIRVFAADNGTRACLAGDVNDGTYGLRFDPNGAVLVVDSTAGLPSGTTYANGLPIAPSGALCVADDTTTWYNQGLPYTANGSIRGTITGTLGDSVAALMAATPGVAKLWLDPSDVATLQQDSAGTTPVTTAGDPIGRIMDKSGAANHLIQATAASCPLWQTTFAAFDGVNDSWVSAANLDMSSTDAITIVMGLRKLSDVTTGVALELSAFSDTTNPGSFAIFAPVAGTPIQQFRTVGTVMVNIVRGASPAPVTTVLSGISDISVPIANLRRNGDEGLPSTSSQGTGNFGNYPLNIGRRNNTNLPLSGNVYGVLIFPRILTPSELDVCEQYMAQKSGISF